MEVDMNRQLLEQLIAFEQYGTLAEVAEHLLIPQPTVTRGMRKLEEELEVVLFDRKPNKIPSKRNARERQNAMQKQHWQAHL